MDADVPAADSVVACGTHVGGKHSLYSKGVWLNNEPPNESKVLLINAVHRGESPSRDNPLCPGVSSPLRRSAPSDAGRQCSQSRSSDSSCLHAHNAESGRPAKLRCDQ